MRILTRYVLKEILGYALLGLVVFTFVLTIPEVLRLSELFAQQSVSLATLLKLALMVLPGKLIWTIPMAVLVGLLVGWSRLAVDGEIVALQATAVGFGRLLWPSTLFATAGFLIALVTSLWWMPQAARDFRALQEELAAGGISYEIQPRVFDERFRNLILYVQDVESGAARWRGILLADTSHPDETRLTLAESGIVVNDPHQRRLQLHLINGSTHELRPEQPERYSVSTFGESDLSLPWPESRITAVELRGNAERTLAELWTASRTGEQGRIFRADFHRRLALPAACLVFALVAVPLGMKGAVGGRATGLVMAFALFVGYYSLFVFADRMGREGVLSPGLGVWASNLVFALVGVVLLQSLRRPARGVSGWSLPLEFVRYRLGALVAGSSHNPNRAAARGRERSGFPRLLDLYVVRGVLFYFVLLLGSFLSLFELFNLLDLTDDIVKHQAPARLVAEYLYYLLPQAFYWTAPLSLLVAVLARLGVLSKRNEIVAIKAAGISLYRIATPVLVLAFLIALALFLLDSSYLPYTNKRQEALRNQLKGRPPQTVFQPQRKWIYGEGKRIFHYRFFDNERNRFGELAVLELRPQGFALARRISAREAHWSPGERTWIFEGGWRRLFDGSRPALFERFAATTFSEITERPEYFKKEVLESTQMNFRELGRYIAELEQSGFEVSRLAVQWHKKFAFPLTTLVMVLLAFPFGLTVGRRGALAGIGIGIGLGLSYWIVSGLFESLGNIQSLPTLLAGWGPNLIFGFIGSYWFLRIRT